MLRPSDSCLPRGQGPGRGLLVCLLQVLDPREPVGLGVLHDFAPQNEFSASDRELFVKDHGLFFFNSVKYSKVGLLDEEREKDQILFKWRGLK